VQQWPYRIVPRALEVIPRTLIQNCGGNTIRTLTALRAKHASNALSNDGDNKQVFWGVNGETGEITNIRELEIWEPLAVKKQIFKTSIEVSSNDEDSCGFS
jgi:T-complex protein 1 subunit gamma